MVEELIKVKLKEYKSAGISGKHDGWIYQFLDEDYNSVSKPCCCKDFLQDVVYTELTNDSFNIYGYTHTKTGWLDRMNRLRLALTHKESKTKVGEFIGNITLFLNTIEIFLGFELSTVNMDDTERVMIIEFSKEWLAKPYLFSLFTYFCRYGQNYNGSQSLEEYLIKPGTENYIEDDDIYYWNNKEFKEHVLSLLSGGELLEQPNWENLNENLDLTYGWYKKRGFPDKSRQVHQSGIISLLECHKNRKYA